MNNKYTVAEILKATTEQAISEKKKSEFEKEKAIARRQAEIEEVTANRAAELAKVTNIYVDIVKKLWLNGSIDIPIFSLKASAQLLKKFGFTVKSPSAADGKKINELSRGILDKSNSIHFSIAHSKFKNTSVFTKILPGKTTAHSLAINLRNLKMALGKIKRSFDAEISSKHNSKKQDLEEELQGLTSTVEKLDELSTKYGKPECIGNLIDIDEFNQEFQAILIDIEVSHHSFQDKSKIKRRAAILTARAINPSLKALPEQDIIDIIYCLNKMKNIRSIDKAIKDTQNKIKHLTSEPEAISSEIGIADDLKFIKRLDSMADATLAELRTLCQYTPSDPNGSKTLIGIDQEYTDNIQLPPRGYYKNEKFQDIGATQISSLNEILNDAHNLREYSGVAKDNIVAILLSEASKGINSITINSKKRIADFSSISKTTDLDISISTLKLLLETEGLKCTIKSSKQRNPTLVIEWL